MAWIAAIVAVLCGIVLIIEVDTGNLDGLQVAGIGLLAAIVAFFSPRTWPPVG